MAEHWAVDRIDGQTVRCEGPDRKIRLFPLEQLPPGVKEGDCLLLTDGIFTPDEEETAKRRQRNRDLFRQLCKRDKE